MSSIQANINQLLGLTAVATKLGTGMASKKYAEERSAELDKEYKAQVAAAREGTTKSGNESHSKKAIDAQKKAEESMAGEGSKMPWNQAVEKKLMEEHTKRMEDLQRTVTEGREKLKVQAMKGKYETNKALNMVNPAITQTVLKNMTSEQRWQFEAKAKIDQQEAFNNFLKQLKGGE